MLEILAIIDLVAIVVSFIGLCIVLACTAWIRHKDKMRAVDKTPCYICKHKKVCTYSKLYQDMCEQINEYMINTYDIDDPDCLIAVNVQCVDYENMRGTIDDK